MGDCIFCKIANGEIPSATLYEDEEFRVILDLGPASKGHSLILPKKHAANIYELPDETAGKAMILEDEEGILKDFVQMNAQQKKDAAASFAAYAAEHVSTDKNMRASKEYRSLLVKVLTRRAWEEIGGRAE